jgi:hypothetical protein
LTGATADHKVGRREFGDVREAFEATARGL